MQEMVANCGRFPKKRRKGVLLRLPPAGAPNILLGIQQPAKSISLDFVKNGLSSGVYLAKLMCGDKQTSFRLSIQR